MRRIRWIYDILTKLEVQLSSVCYSLKPRFSEVEYRLAGGGGFLGHTESVLWR